VPCLGSALSEYVSAVYNTTIVKDVSACDFSGLAHLQCGREDPWRTAPWSANHSLTCPLARL
jgi:hypothetical protein